MVDLCIRRLLPLRSAILLPAPVLKDPLELVIEHAIRDQKALEFIYLGLGWKPWPRCAVQPTGLTYLGLSEQSRTPYVIGRHTGQQTTRWFSLYRMRDLLVVDDRDAMARDNHAQS